MSVFKKNKKKIGLILAWIIIALSFMEIQQRWWLRPNFVDEQDNFVLGNSVLEGEKLYQNIFSYHQPASYLVSALVQNTLKTNNILMLIKYHRFFVFGWSMGWWLLMILCFGGWIFGPMIILETVKIIYLGNLFLAESLVLLPIIFVGLWLIDNKNNNYGSAFLLGIITAFCGLTLAPLWPVLILVIVTFWWRWKDKRIVAMIIGALFLIGLIASKVDILGYFENAIYINKNYYLSIASKIPLSKTLIFSFLTPFLYIINQNKMMEILIIKIMVGIFLIAELIYGKKNWKGALQIYLILALLNLRNFELERTHYGGFHLMIWIGWLILISFWLIRKINTKHLRLLILFPAIVLLMIINKQIREKNGLIDDFEIYYSRIFNMSQAIKVSATENDRLLSMPDEVLGYWKTGVKVAGKYLFFYKWMETVPGMRQEQINSFSSLPEYLILKSSEGLPVEQYLTKYQRFSYRGEKMEFYIEKNKWKKMEEKVKEKVVYYGFEAIDD